MTLQTGTVIAGRYRLDRLLGEGGMGSVWSATHSVTGGRVALKFVKSAIDNPETRRRFLREARVATLVEHPNVVSIRDVFDHDDTPVIVMDLLHGETLADRVERLGRLELGDAARIGVAVIAAAGAAHEVGLIHRDLKPENVFLSKTTNGEVVRVLDFGIAKLVRAPDDALTTAVTQTGAVIGTPAYMAPEQLFGEKDLDHRVDVWSIGVMLHEMLTGVRPVDGENFGQIAKKLLSQPLMSIAAFRADLPRDVVAVVDHMLVRERAERLVDLNEAAAVLAPYGAAPKPSFGPPRMRPQLDSDETRVVVTEAADPKAPTENVASGSLRRHDPEASTVISSPGAQAVSSPSSSSRRGPLDTGGVQVAATMVSGTTNRSRARAPWLVSAAVVAVAAIAGLVLVATPSANEPAHGAASAKTATDPTNGGAAKHVGSTSLAASAAAPVAASAAAPAAASTTAPPTATASAEPAPSTEVETPPSASSASSGPKPSPAIAPKAYQLPKPVVSASAPRPAASVAVPPPPPTPPTAPPATTVLPGLQTSAPF